MKKRERLKDEKGREGEGMGRGERTLEYAGKDDRDNFNHHAIACGRVPLCAIVAYVHGQGGVGHVVALWMSVGRTEEKQGREN